ncbi:MAG: hypothetical protein ACRETH_05325, partial [Steroidobacteraceae bacterium]
MASAASNPSRSTGAVSASSPGGAPASSHPSVDLTAVTTRDDFLLELGQALGGQAAIRPVDSLEAAFGSLTGTRRGQVLVIDDAQPGGIRAAVDAAQARAPHAVVLVFTTAESEKQVGAAVKGSNVFAVLALPIDKRQAGAVLDGAMTEAVARKAAARANPSASQGVTVESFQPRLDSGSTPPPEREKSKAALWAGLGIAAVALAGGGYWFVNKNKGAPAAPVARASKAVTPPSTPAADNTTTEGATLEPKPNVDTAIVSGKVDELLEKARLAMRERRYLEPVGDNALLYYRSAAAAGPNSGEAKDGLQRVAAVAAARFEESMT